MRVEVGWFRQGQGRWNRWIGRIVLVQGKPPDLLVSVKVYGETWILRGRGPVVGAAACPQTWDTVNSMVDPQAVWLMQLIRRAEVTPWAGLDAAVGKEEELQVKLRGRIEGVRSYRGSVLLSLEIGQAKVSALVSDPETAVAWWRPGMPVECRLAISLVMGCEPGEAVGLTFGSVVRCRGRSNACIRASCGRKETLGAEVSSC